MKRKNILFLLLSFAFFTLPLFAESLKISVSIAPLEFFVEKIAGDKATIFTIVPANKNAETYEPDFTSMQNLTQSNIFIGIGMPFESIWLPRILDSSGKAKDIKVLNLHKKLQGKEHAHLWLSIENAKKITQFISEELSSYDTKNAEFYRNNAQQLLALLQALQTKLQPIIQSMPRKDFIVYHPIFDDYAKEFGLIEHALEQHGKKYGIKDILNLSQKGKELGIKRIFAQSKNQDMTTLAKSMNAKLVLINPFSKDYLNNLESIVSEIAKSYQE